MDRRKETSPNRNAGGRGGTKELQKRGKKKKKMFEWPSTGGGAGKKGKKGTRQVSLWIVRTSLEKKKRKKR